MAGKLLRKQDVAQVLGVSVPKAAELMKEMRCINLSRNPDSLRPRWAVTEEELTRWQREKAQVPAQRTILQNKPGRRKAPVVVYDPRFFEPDGRIKRKRA